MKSVPMGDATALRARLNQTIVPVVSAIEHVERVGLGVAEDEEIVPEKLQLQHGLGLGHRLGVHAYHRSGG